MGPHNKDVRWEAILDCPEDKWQGFKEKEKGVREGQEVCIEKFKNPLVTGINSWDPTLRKSKLEENI